MSTKFIRLATKMTHFWPLKACSKPNQVTLCNLQHWFKSVPLYWSKSEPFSLSIIVFDPHSEIVMFEVRISKSDFRYFWMLNFCFQLIWKNWSWSKLSSEFCPSLLLSCQLIIYENKVVLPYNQINLIRLTDFFRIWKHPTVAATLTH